MENTNKNKTKTLTRLLLSTLVLSGLVLGGMAFTSDMNQTQTDTPEDSSPPAQGFRRLPPGMQDKEFGFFGDLDFDTFLAEELGITVEELKDAREAANENMLEEAVAKGYISLEQADLISARAALAKYINQDALLAKALGISVEELQATLQDDKSLRTLIDDLGLNMEEVQTNFQAAYQEMIQQAVKEGVITQSQADQLASDGFGVRTFGHGMRPFGGAPRGFPPRTAPDDTNDGL